mmetsp:Transcript_4359/g.7615  ORF Transcript_4359/g.7615 Transcript_4359/m.7615 type:complete len:217 (-) Transcript_4359:2240-2890(-)
MSSSLSLSPRSLPCEALEEVCMLVARSPAAGAAKMETLLLSFFLLLISSAIRHVSFVTASASLEESEVHAEGEEDCSVFGSSFLALAASCFATGWAALMGSAEASLVCSIELMPCFSVPSFDILALFFQIDLARKLLLLLLMDLCSLLEVALVLDETVEVAEFLPVASVTTLEVALPPPSLLPMVIAAATDAAAAAAPTAAIADEVEAAMPEAKPS